MPASKTSIELPVFDVSKPLTPSSLSSLSLACEEWGFFHIINHGISKELYNKLRFLSNQLFDLPHEQKLKAGPSSNIKTYTPHFIASPFFESIRVSGPDFFASARSSAEVLLNQPTSEFSEVLREYGMKMRTLSNKIIEMLLMSLGDDFEKKFEPEFSSSEGYLRINNYSPPEIIEKDVEGLGMHTEIGGLQVRSKEGKWMDIEPCL